MAMTRRQFIGSVVAGVAAATVSARVPSHRKVRERWEHPNGLAYCEWEHDAIDPPHAERTRAAFKADGLRLVKLEWL